MVKTLSDEVKQKIKNSNKLAYQNLSEQEKKRRAKLISRKKSGISTTGNIDWNKVNEIRKLHASGIHKRAIQQKYSEISISTINDIISYRTWKKPPDGLKPQKARLDF